MLRTRRSTSLLDWLVQLLFPISCLGCQKEIDWICPECLRSLAILNEQRCVICKKAAIGGLCAKCRKATALDGVIAPLNYQEPIIRGLIGQAKYSNSWDALLCLTTALNNVIVRRLPEGDWYYAFVPQTKKRSAERGYNQSEIIAKQLARGQLFLGINKVRETLPQATLTRDKRKINLKNAFRVSGKVPEQIVLCDDVITTGNTLATITKQLKQAGAQRVWAVTIAHD